VLLLNNYRGGLCNSIGYVRCFPPIEVQYTPHWILALLMGYITNPTLNVGVASPPTHREGGGWVRLQLCNRVCCTLGNRVCCTRGYLVDIGQPLLSLRNFFMSWLKTIIFSNFNMILR